MQTINCLEILEYASYLGMDVEDKDLLWIAKGGLKSILLEGWRPCRTTSGEIYYFNFRTGESMQGNSYDKRYREFYRKEKAKKDFNTKLEYEMNVNYSIM